MGSSAEKLINKLLRYSALSQSLNQCVLTRQSQIKEYVLENWHQILSTKNYISKSLLVKNTMEKDVWVVKNSTKRLLVRSFDGISGESKWCWCVNGMEEAGVKFMSFWLQPSSSKVAICCFWVWAIRNLWLWALLPLFMLKESRERSKLLNCTP